MSTAKSRGGTFTPATLTRSEYLPAGEQSGGTACSAAAPAAVAALAETDTLTDAYIDELTEILGGTQKKERNSVKFVRGEHCSPADLFCNQQGSRADIESAPTL